MYNIHFKVEGQRVLCDNPLEVASNLINKVTCSFEFLDNSWDGYDIIKAVFTNKKAEITESLLIYKNGQHIPNEVLAYKGKVTMNLVACKYNEETEELVELQMTSFKCDAINVTYQVILEEDEPFTPTPSAFDQYVAIVKNYRDEAEAFKDRTEELASDVEHIIEGVAEEVEQKIQPKLDVKANKSEITRLENEIVDKASIGQLAEVTREVASVKETKQNKLVAGANITIEGDVISAESGLAEVEWADVKNKPTEFVPTAHSHSASDVDGLDDELSSLDNRLENQEQLLATKVDKEQGKGLSTNDYTDAEKTKLKGLENYDDTVIVDAINTLDEDLQTEKQAIESIGRDVEELKTALIGVDELIGGDE